MCHVRNFWRGRFATSEIYIYFFIIFFTFVGVFWFFWFSLIFNGKLYIAWRMRHFVIHFVLCPSLNHCYNFVTLPLSFGCLIGHVLPLFSRDFLYHCSCNRSQILRLSVSGGWIFSIYVSFSSQERDNRVFGPYNCGLDFFFFFILVIF